MQRIEHTRFHSALCACVFPLNGANIDIEYRTTGTADRDRVVGPVGADHHYINLHTNKQPTKLNALARA